MPIYRGHSNGHHSTRERNDSTSSLFEHYDEHLPEYSDRDLENGPHFLPPKLEPLFGAFSPLTSPTLVNSSSIISPLRSKFYKVGKKDENFFDGVNLSRHNLRQLRYQLWYYLKSRINKFIVSLLIIFITLSIMVRNMYLSRAYVQAPRHWEYLEPTRLDVLSDEKTIDLVLTSSSKTSLPYMNSRRDTRVMPALHLNHILRTVNNNHGVIPDNLKFDFAWQDWINFDERLLPNDGYLLEHDGQPILNCRQFAQELGFPHPNLFRRDVLKGCIDFTEDEVKILDNANYPHLQITEPLDKIELYIEGRILHGALYTRYNMDPPKRLIFVDGSTSSDIIVPVSKNGVSVSVSTSFETQNDLISLEPIDALLSSLYKSVIEQTELERVHNPQTDFARMTKNAPILDTRRIDPTEFNNPDSLDEIKRLLPQHEIAYTLDHDLFSNIKSSLGTYPDSDYPKYFHEPTVNDKDIAGSHYDWRFFNVREVKNEYKRISTLKRIIKAWLRFTNNEDITTWLAHGTMLGYSFNNRMLPWDFDHDVQVTSEAMWKLAKYYNSSLIIDTTIDDGTSTGFGQYYLDISGFFHDRNNTNGNNAIDARFIDVHTGMYIDITQLSKVEGAQMERALKYQLPKAHKVLRSEFYRLLKQYGTNVNQILNSGDTLLSCKNLHFYETEELSELTLVEFDGERAYVPSKYVNILDREFPRRKHLWSTEGYTWRANDSMRLWVKDTRCTKGKRDHDGVTCLEDPLVNAMLHSGVDYDVVWDMLALVEEDRWRSKQ